jgi:hypothetical protein
MKTKQGELFVLLGLLLIEFPEPLEDESVENQPRENSKPFLNFALNGKHGNDEDE